MPERATVRTRSEESAEVVVVSRGGVRAKTNDEGPNAKEC